VQVGFCSALDTLAAQAFGAGDMASIYSTTLLALMLGTIAATPMVLGLLATGPVARVMFQQTDEITNQAAAFCTRLAPGVIPQVRLPQRVRRAVYCMHTMHATAAPADMRVQSASIRIVRPGRAALDSVRETPASDRQRRAQRAGGACRSLGCC
jgi:MatE